MEISVLGAILIDNEALSDSIDILKQEYFYKAEHQFIYEAIANLFQESNPIDILTVTEELKRLGNLKNHVLPMQTPPEKLDEMIQKLAEL